MLDILSRQGVKILEDSTDTETRFAAERGQHKSFTRTGLTWVIRGSILPHGRGTEIRYRVGPGISSLLSMVVLAGVLLYAVFSLFMGKSADPASAYRFLAVGLAANAFLYFFYFLMKKEIREQFLNQLQEE